MSGSEEVSGVSPGLAEFGEPVGSVDVLADPGQGLLDRWPHAGDVTAHIHVRALLDEVEDAVSFGPEPVLDVADLAVGLA